MTRLRAWLRTSEPRDYFNMGVSISAAIGGIGYLIFDEPRAGVLSIVLAGALAQIIHKDRQIRDLRTQLDKPATTTGGA